MPILVRGVDRAGNRFSTVAETLNGSTRGMGLLMSQEPSISSRLLISILHKERRFQLDTEVRHVTAFDSQRNLVGIRFLIAMPATGAAEL
jgi:hypothetical protein